MGLMTSQPCHFRAGQFSEGLRSAVPKLILLFTRECWSAQPYSINLTLKRTYLCQHYSPSNETYPGKSLEPVPRGKFFGVGLGHSDPLNDRLALARSGSGLGQALGSSELPRGASWKEARNTFNTAKITAGYSSRDPHNRGAPRDIQPNFNRNEDNLNWCNPH